MSVPTAVLTFGVVALACLSGACDRRSATTATSSVVDSVVVDTMDGVEYVTNHVRQPHVVRLQRDWVVGGAVDAIAIFTTIWDLEMSRSGGAVLIDLPTKSIIELSATGELLGRYGREGDGPGEFRWPARLSVTDEGIAVWDMMARRLTFLSADGSVAADTTFPRIPPMADLRWTSGSTVLQLGPIHNPAMESGEPATGHVLRLHGPDRTERDTLFTFSDSLSAVAVSLNREGRRGSSVSGIPFGARDHWDANSAGVVCRARGTEYRIDCWEGGKLSRVIMREHGRFPLTAVERDSAEEHVAGYLQETLELLELPALKPALADIVVDAAANVFVRAFKEDDLVDQRWDIYDCFGRYAGSLEFPATVLVKAAANGVVYTITRDDLDAHRIERYSYDVQDVELCSTASNIGVRLGAN